MSQSRNKRPRLVAYDSDDDEWNHDSSQPRISSDTSFYSAAGFGDDGVSVLGESDGGSYRQFCGGTFATSTNVYSEELFSSDLSPGPAENRIINGTVVNNWGNSEGSQIYIWRSTHRSNVDGTVSASSSSAGIPNVSIDEIPFQFSDDPVGIATPIPLGLDFNDAGIDTSDEEPMQIAQSPVFTHPSPPHLRNSQMEQDSEPIDVGDPSLPSIPTPEADDVWNWIDGKDANIEKEEFVVQSGWTFEFDELMTQLDFWKLCFPPDVITKIAAESNVYAEEDIGPNDPDDLPKRKRYFKKITDNDILRYLAIRIIMGINKKPEYTHYWSKDPFFHSVIVPQIMSIDRFLQIQKYLHFCDSDDALVSDKLRKIRGLWTTVTNQMESLIDPGEALAIDESLTKFRGRLSFRQYIPSKRNRFGIKTFSLVDKNTGFVTKSIIYTGKSDDTQFKHSTKEYGYGGAIVLELCEQYLEKNHTIYCDNYFTSPKLAEKLLQRRTYICGTLRARRKNSPPVPKLAKGGCCALVCERNGKAILVEYWKDKRIVRTISTGISHEMLATVSRSGVEQTKPRSVHEYNHNARGIDLADMAISEYDTARKTLKWYMKLFFRLIDLSIYNAFVIMKSHHGRTPFLDFRISLVKQILESTGGVNVNVKPPVLCERINAPHYPVKFSSPRRCKVCSVRRKGDNVRSLFGCGECNVGLCTFPCFGVFHKTQNF